MGPEPRCGVAALREALFVPADKPPLPIDDALPELLTALAHHQAVVLRAPPGAGKTTRVPPALVDAGFAKDGVVLLLEPRRLAARASARRMAEERGEPLGKSIGYQVRFEERRSKDTRVLVVTEGILTRRFLDDPLLEGVAAVVLDEFHERSVHTDLCLAFTRELLSVRDDLKLVVMSATIDPGPLSTYLGGSPVVTSEGRRFPLDITHASGRDDRPLEQRVRSALFQLLRADDDDGGDILAFLPGAPEIRRAQRLLEEEPLPDEVEVVPLYGALESEAQDRALRRGRHRRVVLATNIAETSLTLEGVTAVVDTGLEKRLRHDARTGLERLETVRISRYSAEQRAGRAGRTAPGRVVRLWSQAEHSQLDERAPPELLRTDLASPLLQVLAFQPGDPRDFPFFEAPPPAHLERALELLRMLDAIHVEEGRWQLTERGRRLAKLPLPPRLGVLLLESARAGMLEDGAVYAALLSERDVLRPLPPGAPPPPPASSDLEHRLEVLEELESERFSPRAARALHADERAAREVAKARDQLLRLARGLARSSSKAPPERAHARALLAAFPDRLCVAKEGRTALMVGGRGVELARSSAVHDASLFVALDVEDTAGPRGLVRLAASVERDDVEAVLGHLLASEESALLEGERGTVVGVARTRVKDLVLEEKRGARVSPAVAERALADAIRAEPGRVFQPSEGARSTLERLAYAKRVLPEHDWPTLDEEWVREHADELVLGKRSLADVAALDWSAVLDAALPWELRRALDEELPERVTVPSGSRVALDYGAALGPEEAPVLAVRLQELFGLNETPRIAKGRVPVLLHLLAPNMRPVQVTRDLESFWNHTYDDVKKELRRRYPKHAWPDDPWTAPPERRPRRKR